uniref:Glutathione transferase n=1 Tax=Arion vulgaris TaxID=1028688 RepID=A0A0B6YSW4_9EUPU
MSEQLRYIYFNVKARGELPRLICAAAGIDYIDERVEDVDWLPKYKSKTPYGQIPVLEVDGTMYAQKLAISLYFARKGGLYPISASELDLLKLDHTLLFVEEVLEDYVAAQVDKIYNNKPETLPKVKAEIFPRKIPLLENLLKVNGSGYFCGNKMTIVDLSAFDFIEQVVNEMGKNYLDAYPLLKAHFAKIGQVEGIKSYLAKRPPSTITW